MKRSLAVAGLFVFAALVAPDVRAQTGTARGKVVDEGGQPVPDAKIDLEFLGGVTRKYATKSNKKGEYTQVGLHPGQYKVICTKEGYQGGFIEARISLGEPTYLPDIKLVSKETAIKEAEKKASDEISGPFNQAIELTKAGKLDEAEAVYKQLLEKNPAIPQIHYNLGYICNERKDYAGAEASLKKALELKPDFSEASVLLARVYQLSGQKDKALELMSGAGSSGDAKAQFNLGVMHLEAQRLDDAEAAFKKAEQLDPSNAEVHFHLASIAINQGKTEDCIARLEKYLSMSPQNQRNAAAAQGLLAALKPKK